MGDSIFDIGANQILLLVLLVLLVGAGTYITYFQQQSTLESLAQQIEAREEEKQTIEELQTELSRSQERLASVREKWRTQYKTVPETTSSSVVVGYLTDLTRTGFRTFDVTSLTAEQRNGYSAYALEAEGKAFFPSFYRFVWMIENNRPFYRVRDLSLNYLEERTTDEGSGRTSMDVLVSFQMNIEAIYGAVGGLEPPRADVGGERRRLPTAQRASTPPVPTSVLPAQAPNINPFYPLVFEEVPPNEEGRLNVESARLISIIGGQAIFQTGSGIERVSEGDRVYLGRVVTVDAEEGRVVARLNRGGIVDEVELTLDTDSPLQQTSGRGTSPSAQEP